MAQDYTPETVFVRGTGGAIFEMDIPAGGMALERFEQSVAKGELVIIDEAHWVERGDGSKYLVAGPAEDAPKARKARGAKKARKARGAKSAPVDEAPADDPVGDDGEDIQVI